MAADEVDAAPLSPDDVTDLLADRRRRYLLYCLLRHTNPVSLATVADCVTEWELGAPAEDVPDERLRVYMSLYHDHLPALADAGVLRYCQAEDLVELAAAAERLEPTLRRTADRDLPAPDRRD